MGFNDGEGVNPFYWIAGGLVLALGVEIALFDWNMVKPYAERQLSDASGLTVSLQATSTSSFRFPACAYRSGADFQSALGTRERHAHCRCG